MLFACLPSHDTTVAYISAIDPTECIVCSVSRLKAFDERTSCQRLLHQHSVQSTRHERQSLFTFDFHPLLLLDFSLIIGGTTIDRVLFALFASRWIIAFGFFKLTSFLGIVLLVFLYVIRVRFHI